MGNQFFAIFIYFYFPSPLLFLLSFLSFLLFSQKDGVAVFWDAKKFSLVHNERIDFDDIAGVVDQYFPPPPRTHELDTEVSQGREEGRRREAGVV